MELESMLNKGAYETENYLRMILYNIGKWEDTEIFDLGSLPLDRTIEEALNMILERKNIRWGGVVDNPEYIIPKSVRPDHIIPILTKILKVNKSEILQIWNNEAVLDESADSKYDYQVVSCVRYIAIYALEEIAAIRIRDISGDSIRILKETADSKEVKT